MLEETVEISAWGYHGLTAVDRRPPCSSCDGVCEHRCYHTDPFVRTCKLTGGVCDRLLKGEKR